MECEFCNEKATVEWIVQGYIPKKTHVVIAKHPKCPIFGKYGIYLCGDHDEKGLSVFAISLPCICSSRKLEVETIPEGDSSM